MDLQALASSSASLVPAYNLSKPPEDSKIRRAALTFFQHFGPHTDSNHLRRAVMELFPAQIFVSSDQIYSIGYASDEARVSPEISETDILISRVETAFKSYLTGYSKMLPNGLDLDGYAAIEKELSLDTWKDAACFPEKAQEIAKLLVTNYLLEDTSLALDFSGFSNPSLPPCLFSENFSHLERLSLTGPISGNISGFLNLKTIELENTLIESVTDCPELESLLLKQCHEITKIDASLQNLQKLVIENCKEVETIDEFENLTHLILENLPKLGSLPFASSLFELCLVNCPCITRVASFLELTYFVSDRCPLEELFDLPSLKDLRLKRCSDRLTHLPELPNLRECFLEKTSIGNFSESTRNLNTLSLKSTPMAELPKNLLLLRTLTIKACPISTIPNLRIEKLRIENAEDLVSIASQLHLTHAFLRDLPKLVAFYEDGSVALERLTCENCPALRLLPSPSENTFLLIRNTNLNPCTFVRDFDELLQEIAIAYDKEDLSTLFLFLNDPDYESLRENLFDWLKKLSDQTMFQYKAGFQFLCRQIIPILQKCSESPDYLSCVESALLGLNGSCTDGALMVFHTLSIKLQLHSLSGTLFTKMEILIGYFAYECLFETTRKLLDKKDFNNPSLQLNLSNIEDYLEQLESEMIAEEAFDKRFSQETKDAFYALKNYNLSMQNNLDSFIRDNHFGELLESFLDTAREQGESEKLSEDHLREIQALFLSFQEERKNEEVENYLLLLKELKPFFNFPIMTPPTMIFLNETNLSEQEIAFARQEIAVKIESFESCLNFFTSESGGIIDLWKAELDKESEFRDDLAHQVYLVEEAMDNLDWANNTDMEILQELRSRKELTKDARRVKFQIIQELRKAVETNQICFPEFYGELGEEGTSMNFVEANNFLKEVYDKRVLNCIRDWTMRLLHERENADATQPYYLSSSMELDEGSCSSSSI